MKNFVLLLTVGCFVNVANCAKYPTDLPQCKNADENCLKRTITEVISKNSGGHRALHLLSIDPLKIKSMIIAQDASSPVNIQLKFSDTIMYGLKDTKVYKTKGFEKDPKTAKFEVSGKIPKLELIGPYEIKGQVLILPIAGKGNSNMTLENIDAKLKIIGDVAVKNGEEYLKVTKVKLDFDITRLYMNFENLFNGDKALGDNMNLFLNENWEEIFKELKSAIADSISDIFKIVIENPFSAIPYKKLFLE